MSSGITAPPKTRGRSVDAHHGVAMPPDSYSFLSVFQSAAV